MHGRVKVKTSEEEKLRRDKERAEKLKVFKHCNEKIYEKWNKHEWDEDLLKLTEKVLLSNPDIYTLWNMRKTTLVELRKKLDNIKELSNLHDSELILTEHCLKVNPKSYCAWYQRQWVLTTRIDPDWKKEMDICNTYLKLDERNFHTWDYRKFVVNQYQPPLEEEFDFTTEKLLENFSNYSAWHYRSKLLLQLHPDSQCGRPIKDAQHKHELKLIQSAAFTDPDDTSAWFYQRWLLGAVKVITQMTVCTITKDAASFAFNVPVEKDFISSAIKLFIDDTSVKGEWESCTKNPLDTLWLLKRDEAINEGLKLKVEYQNETGIQQSIFCKEVKPAFYIGRTEVCFQRAYSQPIMEELEQQLESCQQLLALEPDSKWTLLATTFFLYCINAKDNHEEIVKNLSKLKDIDKLRLGYYEDLISKWNIEHQISQDFSSDQLNLKIDFKEKLTALPHLQYYSFCVFVDLSKQNLTSKSLCSLVRLVHCKVLNLEDNNITTLNCFPLINLIELKLKGNPNLDMTSVICLQDRLKCCIDV